MISFDSDTNYWPGHVYLPVVDNGNSKLSGSDMVTLNEPLFVTPVKELWFMDT